MKKTGMVLIGLAVITACNRKQSPARSDAAKDILTVMSYNIHHANPPSRKDSIDLEAIAKVIIQQQPDLVALQEVDVHTRRSGTTLHEAEALAAKTGMKAYFAKAINYDGGEYGIAILSRYPLSNTTTYQLPVAAGTNGEPRVLATAEVALPGKRKIVFACTHLDAQKNDTNRLLQIRSLTDILKKEKLPVIIGGDFNAEPSGAVISILDGHFTRTCINDCGFTIPATTPVKTIDFIAWAPVPAFQTISHKVIDEKYASDHLPVVAVLRIVE